MTSKITSLTEYRATRKRLFMQDHKQRVERFVKSFISKNFKINYDMINQYYLTQKASENELAWDYHDFRDELKDAIAKVFGEQMWREVKTMYWFDPICISKDELLETCMTVFILGNTKAANA